MNLTDALNTFAIRLYDWSKQTSIHRDLLPALQTADRSLPSFLPVDPDHCLDALASSLSPLIGQVTRHRSAIRCTRRISDWKIVTELPFLGGEREVFFDS